jgi:hypothetical protein
VVLAEFAVLTNIQQCDFTAIVQGRLQSGGSNQSSVSHECTCIWKERQL